MISIKVAYTVKPEYTEQNKANIKAVMEALKKNPIEGMYYSSHVLDSNPCSFMHFNMAKDHETMAKLNRLEEFKYFQDSLKTSQPEIPPKATKMAVVAEGFLQD